MKHQETSQTEPADDRGRFVLRGRQLREGIGLESTALFSDSSWSLNPAVLQKHCGTKVLNFSGINPLDVLATKLLMDTLLSGDLPPGEQRYAVTSTQPQLGEVKRFLAWLDHYRTLHGKPALTIDELTADDLAEYPQYLRAGALPIAAVRAALHAPRYFWRYRTALDGRGLTCDPRTVDAWSQPHPMRTENSTDRIPEQVLGTLITWAIRFVDDFSPDILAAHQQWIRRRHNALPGNRLRQAAGLAAFNKLMDAHVAAHRPLPGRKGMVNRYFLATTIGCQRNLIDQNKDRLDLVAAQVGISERSPYWIDIQGRIDRQPWITDINTDFSHPHGLSALARMLQTACYILTAYLSGMRDSEVKHLQRGCLRETRDTDNKPYRWEIAARAFKGETDPAGTEATWVVGHPVARAILVLQQLQPPEVSYLFTPLPHSPGNGPANRSMNQALTTNTTNRQIVEFIGWVNNYCQDSGRADHVPDVDGRQIRLTTRQFRRTLAWFIARQPGGSIAGAIQYRHLSIQMFEGYAGTTDSGFRAEVEAEQALSRGDFYFNAITDHNHTLTGPAGDEGQQRLQLFQQRTGYAGQTITDRYRLIRLINRNDPAIYPGTYATCVFNPDRALCQPRGDKASPAQGNCQPLHCKNVALDTDNITALRAELASLEQNLEMADALPPLLKHRLVERRQDIAQFLITYTTEDEK